MASPRKRYLNRHVLPPIAAGLLRSVGRTWRFRDVNLRVHSEALRQGRPLIGTFMHGRAMPLLYFMSRPGQRQWSLMISSSADGDLMGGVAQRLGFGTIRGSSGRGGARALVNMIRAARERRKLGLAMDGSRGPRGHLQGGIIALAQKTGGLIIPVGAGGAPCKLLSSWDRWQFVYPGATVCVAWGEPIEVPAKLTAEEFEHYRRRAEAAVLRATARADDLVGVVDGEPLQVPLPNQTATTVSARKGASDPHSLG